MWTILLATTVALAQPRPAPVMPGAHGARPAAARYAPAPPPGPPRFSLGLTLGAEVGGYHSGRAWADGGLGLAFRYRPAPGLGVEVAVRHHDATWAPGSPRSVLTGQGSVIGFFAPWSPVQPYVLGGLTTRLRINDPYAEALDGRAAPFRVGAHAGGGVHIGLGPHLGLDLDGRLHALLGGNDAAFPVGFQAHAGLVARW